MNGRSKVEYYIENGVMENLTFDSMLDILAEKYTYKTALVDMNGRITYGELREKAQRLAGVFTTYGITKEDNVIVWMNNRIEFFCVIFGLFYIGARPILMLPTHRKKELESISEFAKPSAIITYGIELGVDYVKAANEVKKMYKSIKNVFSYQTDKTDVDLQHLQEVEYGIYTPVQKSEASDIALFLLSGGTTGIPKLIPKRHAAYLYNARCSAQRCGVSEDSVYLAALSIAHDFPLCCPGIFGTMLYGGKSVLSTTASFDEVGQWIKEEKVTFSAVAPVVAEMWIECMEWEEDVDISSLRYLIIGASKMDNALANKIENLMHVQIIQGYGLGEGITCFTSLNDPIDIRWNYQGKPVSEYDEIKIVDDNGNEVLPLHEGELIERGPYTFEGYYQARELNSKIFTKDGFFCTGDKALMTSDGNIQILGRVIEQINRAGENIIPSEIEEYLKCHTQILDATVIGLPDKLMGERICAVLIKKEVELSKTEICKFLSDKGLANFKQPDCIYYVDKFPYVNIGKINKNLLREWIINKQM